jgi:hypothetical protein
LNVQLLPITHKALLTASPTLNQANKKGHGQKEKNCQKRRSRHL